MTAGEDITFASTATATAGNDARLAAQTGSITLGTLVAGNDAVLNAALDILLGTLTADHDATLTAVSGSITLGTLETGNNATLTAGVDILFDETAGQLTAGYDATLMALAGNITLGTLAAGNDAVLNAGTDILLGMLKAVHDVIMTAGENITFEETATANAGNDARLTALVGNITLGTLEAGNDAILDAALDILLGTLTAVHDVTMTAGENITFEMTATATAGNDAMLTALAGNITLGTLEAGNDAVLEAALDILLGMLSAGHDARMTAGENITFETFGQLTAGNDATLTALAGNITLGTLEAGNDAILDAALDILLGMLSAEHDARMTAGENITFETTATATAGNDATLTALAGNITLGTLEAGNDAVLEAALDILLGILSAGHDVRMTAGENITFEMTATATAGNDAMLTALAGNITLGTLEAGNDGILDAALDILLGMLLAGHDARMTAGENITFEMTATATAGNDATLTALAGSITLGTLEAGNDALLAAHGSIVNITGASAVNVTANNVAMMATVGGIGTQESFIYINSAIKGDGVVYAVAAEDIFIRETDGNLNALIIRSVNGNVTIDVRSGSLIDASPADSVDAAQVAELVSQWDGIAYESGAGVHVYLAEDIFTLLQRIKWITDTDFMVENSNILGAELILSASDSIGSETQIRFDFTDGKTALSELDMAMLAAAEWGDVKFYDAAGNEVSADQAAYMILTVALDVDITSTATITVDVGKNGSLGSESDINLNTVTSHGSGQILIRSAQGIYNARGIVNITGGSNTLGASAGALGTLEKPITIDMAQTGSLTARAGAGIYLTGTAGTEGAGPLNINYIYSPVFVSLIAADIVSDANNDARENITCPSLDIVARAVGLEENFVEIDLAADGVLNVQSMEDVFIEEVLDDLNIGVVRSETGNVTLIAEGFITDFDHTAAADVIGDEVLLISINGGIGAADSYLGIDSSFSGAGSVNAQGPENMYLNETAGNMVVGEIICGKDVYLKAGAGITSGAAAVNVTAQSLYFTAAYVAEETNPLNTAIGFVQGDALSGSVYIRNNGTLRIRRITSPQSVHITATGQILNGNPSGNNIEAVHFVFDAATGVGTAANPLKTVVGYMTGTGGSGSVYIDNQGDLVLGLIQAAATVRLRNTGSIMGDGIAPVNVIADKFLFESGADVGARSLPLYTDINYVEGSVASGSIYIDDINDLSLGLLKCTGNIYLWSGGKITSGISSTNVRASAFWFDAAAGIGTQNTPIRTVITYLEGSAGTGSVWIVNIGKLVIGGVDDTTEGVTAQGSVHLTAMSPIVVTENIRAGADIVLTATDSVGPGDDITVKSGVSIVSTSGDITLRAGDNIEIESGAELSAAGDLLMQCGYQDVDNGVDSSITIDHGVAGASDFEIQGDSTNNVFNIYTNSYAELPIAIFGYEGDDVFNVIVQNLHAVMTLDGGEGSDTYIVYVNDVSGGCEINIKDSGGSGSDTLSIQGTDESDIFLVHHSYVAVYRGTPGAPSAKYVKIGGNSAVEHLEIYGHGGENWYYFDDNMAQTTVYGGSGTDHFQIGQLYPANGEKDIDLAHMRLGYLSNGISFATTLYGGDGNDIFSIYANMATLKAYGEDGDDTFIVRPFLIYYEDGTRKYRMNAAVYIDGGNGFDVLILAKTSVFDRFDITDTTVTGSGLDITYTNIEDVGVESGMPLERAFGIDGLCDSIELPFTNLTLLIILCSAFIVLVGGLIMWIMIRRRKKKRAIAA